MARKDSINPLTAFALHYLEYLTSSGLLITLALILVPLYLFREHSIKKSKTETVSGCRRAGLYRRSNLDDQFSTLHNKVTPRVKALFVYPIKSCRGVELAASEVGSTGLKYDRLFSFAQKIKSNSGESEWRFITQREFPKLALLETQLWLPSAFDSSRRRSSLNALLGSKGRRSTIELESGSPLRRKKGRRRISSTETSVPNSNKLRPNNLEWVANGGCLLIRFGEPSFAQRLGFGAQNEEIRVPLEPLRQRQGHMQYSYEQMSIWKDCPSSINMTFEIPEDTLQKLRMFLGVRSELALFRVDPENERAVTRNLPKSIPAGQSSVGFADAFPVNLLSLASVREIDSNLPGNVAAKDRLCARRFRANIYIEGCSAFAEDEWTRIQVGRCLKPLNKPHEDHTPGITTEDDDSTAENDVPRMQTMAVVDAPYHVACRTARCKMPNVDPSTGIRDNNEPLTTLKKTRDVDPGASPHPCVGMQMIPLFSNGAIQVGEGIQVLEKGEHKYEKMFS